jgi:hypothetical protein
MGGMKNELNPSYKCKYCDTGFRKETTLVHHMCEMKRRWQQEKDTGVQIGLRAYLKFYEITQGSSKTKSYSDFVESPYYSAFVKFGQYNVSIRSINYIKFTEWLLKNNKKLDYWCKDNLYSEWLLEYIKKESPQDALERALKEMEEYADGSNNITNFSDYFKHGSSHSICFHITTGRISPWVLYNCDSGIDFLANLNEEQVVLVMPWIDPDYWNRKFRDYLADTEWCRYILKEAGL